MKDIYVGALFSEDYLLHHGILGMKWGVRRYQNEDGTLTPAGKKEKNANSNEKENRYDKAARASQRDADDLRKAGYKKEADAVQKVADNNREKANRIREKEQKNRQAIKEYRKAFNRSNADTDKADEQWEKAQEAYKSLGKNAITRAIAAARNKSPEAKRYSKMYNKSMDMYDKADAEWAETKKLYKKTGRNAVSRVLNNIKYDLHK